MLDARAVAEFTTAVQAENVIEDGAALAAAATATFTVAHRIPLILRPSSRQHVQECVRIANRHRIPLYPVSGGKNWGYGSSVPAADECVLLDLSRMNRIVDYSEKH